MPAPDSVARLVKRFGDNREDYVSGSYNETRLRREFIDPFFKALGWDMDNEQGYAESYKEVIHEDAIRIGGVHKAPDYAFRIGGQRKFFVEAKRPSVNIRTDSAPAFQLRRYAWSAKLPVSVLTDFGAFAIYDTRVRPKAGDKATTSRIAFFTCDEYVEKWGEIESLFSRDAVLRGQFDKFAEAKSRKGVATVDDAFLKDIEGWREELARNIAKRNTSISNRELNHAVQITIDRIVFLRICEDRGVEEYGQLLALLNGNHTYARMVELFAQADAKYNSGLFHFRKEKGRADAPDGFTPSLAIDDKTLKDIIGGLYPPDSPYEFSVIPAEILGHVYERFLGKVIRLTAGHRAVVEDKPEVRHSKGVYYTPTFIVNEIVGEIIGGALEGKTPKQITDYRIVDPACGSGGFLLGAFDFLLTWYTKWYLENEPESWARSKAPTLAQRGEGVYVLTTAERKRILLTHIFGVDIDAQAVEVTKLSLLLKVLEGETAETLQTQFGIFRERALPDLEQNIKWGNSLIDSRYYDQQELGITDDDVAYRVNAFDWEKQFPHVFTARRRGFDAVIGNPPYIRIQSLSESAPEEAQYYRTQFATAAKGNFDLYIVFIEKALSLLVDSGQMGFIVPNKFFNAKYGEALRGMLSRGGHVRRLVNFGDIQVFKGATTYTSLLFASKARTKQLKVMRVEDIAAWRAGAQQPNGIVKASELGSAEWNLHVGNDAELFARLNAEPIRLRDVAARIFQGIIPGADKVYSVELISQRRGMARCFSRALDEEVELEAALLRPIVGGAEVGRFALSDSGQRVIYPYVVEDEDADLIPPDVLSKQYPATWDYFKRTRDDLNLRDRGGAKGPLWYRYIRSQNIGLQGARKIAVPRLVQRLKAAYDEDGLVCLDNVDVGGVILSESHESAYEVVLALLNSQLLNFFFIRNAVPFRGGYFSANRQYIENLPLRMPKEARVRARLVELAKSASHSATELSIAQSKSEQDAFRRRLEASESAIDELVYGIYGLSDDEIRIVVRGRPTGAEIIE